MVDFFVSWTDSDPQYQSYFKDCNILISSAHVPQSWNIKRFIDLPARLMVDSGAFTLIANPSYALTQARVFDRQLNISYGSSVPTILCHLDVPIPPRETNTLEVYRRIEMTVANAYDFMKLFRSAGLAPNFKSLGVIQGNSYDSISFCANELAKIGFDYLGIGSLAQLYRAEIILERVSAAIRVIGPELHIFGISGMEVISQLIALGVRSFDSSRPMKVAMYNCLLYSRPLRMYRLKNSLDWPIVCSCPICKKDPSLIFDISNKKHHNLRAIHNYYHLRQEIDEICYRSHSEISQHVTNQQDIAHHETSLLN